MKQVTASATAENERQLLHPYESEMWMFLHLPKRPK